MGSNLLFVFLEMSEDSDVAVLLVIMWPGVSPQELIALYRTASACIISSIEDGMNLVSQEFIAAWHFKLEEQEKEKKISVPGTLILTENIGVAQAMRGLNAFKPLKSTRTATPQETAIELKNALEASPHERRTMHENGWLYVKKNTAEHWASVFVNEHLVNAKPVF